MVTHSTPRAPGLACVEERLLEGARRRGGGRRHVGPGDDPVPELLARQLVAVDELLGAEADGERDDAHVALLGRRRRQIAGAVGDDLDARHRSSLVRASARARSGRCAGCRVPLRPYGCCLVPSLLHAGRRRGATHPARAPGWARDGPGAGAAAPPVAAARAAAAPPGSTPRGATPATVAASTRRRPPPPPPRALMPPAPPPSPSVAPRPPRRRRAASSARPPGGEHVGEAPGAGAQRHPAQRARAWSRTPRRCCPGRPPPPGRTSPAGRGRGAGPGSPRRGPGRARARSRGPPPRRACRRR